MKYRMNFDEPRGNRLVLGLILVGIGVLALFGSLGIALFNSVLGTLLFGGLAFYLYREGTRTGRSGMRLAALPLAGLALAALLPGSAGGALFLALIGLAFAYVWRMDRSRWWAIIPAGTFASLAAVAGLGGMLGRADGFVFLGGLAATFYALTRLRVSPQSWAIWPAGGLALVAVLSLMGSGGWLVPLLLIGGGLLMLARGGFVQRADRSEGVGAAGPEQPLVRTDEVTHMPTADRPAAPQAPAAPAPIQPAPTDSEGPAEPQG